MAVRVLDCPGTGPARAVHSDGLSQSASSPCDPRRHQTARKSPSAMPALAASLRAPSRTVSVTGARFALRNASQSAHVCGLTSSGQAGAQARPFFCSFWLMANGLWLALPSHCVFDAFAYAFAYAFALRSLHLFSADSFAFNDLPWNSAISSSARPFRQPSSVSVKNASSTERTAFRSCVSYAFAMRSHRSSGIGFSVL